jgi:hypothetical protein
MNKALAFNLIILSLFISCGENSISTEGTYSSVTLDEIYQNKITTYVDSLINLESKLYWEYSYNIIELSDSLHAGFLRLKFDNADNYISDDRFKNQFRGDFFAVSNYIFKKWDGLIEKYYFKNDSLSNNKIIYILKGRIQFRDWLNVNEYKLRDSVFINQCNNIVYWSQTFEFQIEDILTRNAKAVMIEP